MLKPIAENLWSVESEMVMPGGVRLPLRMTVIRVGTALMLVSPVALEEADAQALDQLGEVRWIVGPNAFHHLHLRAAKERWPRARLMGAPDLVTKRNDLPWDITLGAGQVLDGVHTVPIAGAPKVGEVPLFHTPSRTLVVTDLVFNMKSESWQQTLAFGLMGVDGGVHQSRAWRWVFAEDKKAVGEGARKVLEWDFDRLVPAHGAVVDAGAASPVRRALEWMAGL